MAIHTTGDTGARGEKRGRETRGRTDTRGRTAIRDGSAIRDGRDGGGLRRRAVAAAGALALTGLLSAFVPTEAHAAARPATRPGDNRVTPAPGARPAALPAPTGPYAVGTTVRHLVDTSRADPWKPEQGRREVMVSLFYPADRGTGAPAAPHMDAVSAAHFGSAQGAGSSNYGVRPDAADWASTRTHARVDVPVARAARALPVVLYSSGLGDPRTWNTTLVEELASRGYVVVTVDHTYDSSEVLLPGGRLAESVLPALAGAPVRDVDAALRTAMKARVDDTRFVLDTLGSAGWRRGLPNGLGQAMDLRRVGMAGQSAGGFTAAQAMHDDRRIRAGINMDGQMDFPLPDSTGSKLSTVAREGVDRPFLLLGSDGPGADDNTVSWASFLKQSRGDQRQATLAGARHGTFTDAPSLLPALVRQGALTEDALQQDIGTLRPERAVAATRAYVVSFFDRYLKAGRLKGDQPEDGPKNRL